MKYKTAGLTKKQLSIPWPIKPCEHRSCFCTKAYVPAGIVCSDCGKLLLQYIPQPPEVLGYLSADWAWKHKYGKDYTTKEVTG